MITYSQNFEDVYIARAFADVSNGFYVDLGAYDPFVDSVTAHFYLNNWSGINVEPGPSFSAFNKHRSRDINVNVAISDREGAATLFFHEGDPGTSTLNSSIEPALEFRVGKRIRIEVPAVRLKTLLDSNANGRHIHFLKIDVEGLEEAIIRDTDWLRYRPELLIIEATLPYTNHRRDNAWGAILGSFNYFEVFFDGINVYYLRKESMARAHAFRMPVNILDNAIKFQTDILPTIQLIRDSTVGDTKNKPDIVNICLSLAKDVLNASDVHTRRSYAERHLMLATKNEANSIRQTAERQMEYLSKRFEVAVVDLQKNQRQLALAEDDLSNRDKELNQLRTALHQSEIKYKVLAKNKRADSYVHDATTRSLRGKLTILRAKLVALHSEARRMHRVSSENVVLQRSLQRKLADRESCIKDAVAENAANVRRLAALKTTAANLSRTIECAESRRVQREEDYALSIAIDVSKRGRADALQISHHVHEIKRLRDQICILEANIEFLRLEQAARIEDLTLTFSIERAASKRQELVASRSTTLLLSELREAMQFIEKVRQVGIGRVDDRKPKAQGLINRIRAKIHQVLLELRRSEDERIIISAGLFDSVYYLKENPDVALSGIDALRHYILHGANEGRNPHPLFDDEFYRKENPDVDLKQINPLVHFIRHGVHEGRRRNKFF